MEDVLSIVIGAVILIVSAVAGAKKKKVEPQSTGRDAQKPVSPFPFFGDEDDLNERYEMESPAQLSKEHFSYESVNTEHYSNEYFTYENMNEKENCKGIQEMKNEEQEDLIEVDFDIKKAIIYSEILNRPYS